MKAGTTAPTAFQFTPLREGRRNVSKQQPDGITFQFTPLREGRQERKERDSLKRIFQFTPLREGRQHPRGVYVLGIGISIHAPPRGATVHGVCWGYWNLISIHAPPRGATRHRDTAGHHKRFQFTPLREGRRVDGRGSAGRHHFNSRPSARGDNHG